jgi:hypothetical protein
METELIEAMLSIVFEAGRWLGQVDLEEHYDKEQYSTSLMEVAYSAKTSTPIEKSSMGRQVKINLRSSEWREGVRKSSNEYLEKARSLFYEYNKILYIEG